MLCRCKGWSPACIQTRESVAEFATKCKPYKLTKYEINNIINIKPTSYMEVDPIIENLDSRLGESGEEVVELVVQLFSLSADQVNLMSENNELKNVM
ncbi:hypothetical protein E3N88_17280 [Mikania micrantha]|uniref:DNA-directed RNA polymerase III subunit RPC9 n=1 Tax=Mikania micrantha TaxID=192012 RepID=A0A5N6NRY5_9ASTR|nr:hypothetical protein E3N88_17280 [Mikania micrantha]